VRRVPARAHWQPVEYNALHGGLERWFEPIADATLAAPAWNRILVAFAALASRLKGAQPWFVEAHQFRIDTTDGIGRPTPEGAHRDGVDLVAVVWSHARASRAARRASSTPTGRTACASRCSSRGPRSSSTTRASFHESTPIQPLESYGHRDTLVLTYRGGGFQGPAEACVRSRTRRLRAPDDGHGHDDSATT
jgi:hypothetical protein